MSEAELEVSLEPDMSAIENVEQQEMEVSGETRAVEDAKSQNEERNGMLAVITQTLKRLASPIIVLAAFLLTILAPVIQRIRDALATFDFGALRQLLVRGIDDLINVFSDLMRQALNTLRSLPSDLASRITPNISIPSLGGGSNNDGGGLRESLTDFTMNVVTSRDALIGDSSQKQMETDELFKVDSTGGS